MIAVASATALVLLLLFVAGISAWSAITAVRMGVFTNRNGIEISRLENPVLFWMYISLGFFVPVIVGVLFIAVVWLVVRPSSGA